MRSLNKKREDTDVKGSGFLFKTFLYILPLVLFFSYYPLMHFGADETMNFEISLPIIWLVLFDLLVFVMLIKRNILFKDCKKTWFWLLFPVFLTISVLWSLNKVRGILVAGILWLIVFAVYGIYSFREYYNLEFRAKFFKCFFGSTIFICLWCVLQCVLDLAGISRTYSLMCEGCTYASFGFPHPNGFAIEPQFMGNLLLAPALTATWLLCGKQNNKNLRLNLFSGFFLFFAITATLFLTFSRGAIYSFVVGMVFMTVFSLVKEKKGIWKRVGMIWLTTALAFIFTLNAQGLMAAVSPTDDTYFTGVSKALNHLSLGIIDIRGKDEVDSLENTEENLKNVENMVVEKPVENFLGGSEKKSVFDGYVVESTETRTKLTEAALDVWAKDPKTVLFGVGLGGAGQAIFNNGFTDSPKEIVQNQYASLLLETGIFGILILVWTFVMIFRLLVKNKNAGLVFSLFVAYGVSLVFFAGLPNAPQIYLLPVIFTFLRIN